MARSTVVIVGAGFSAALTQGPNPILGHGPLPTLTELGPLLYEHAVEATTRPISNFNSFSGKNIEAGIEALRTHFSDGRSVEESYNFEQFISLLAFRASLFNTSLRDVMPEMPGDNPAVLRFVLHGLYDFFATKLAHDHHPFANRTFHYRVNDEGRTKALRTGLFHFVDERPVTFISFNYDGILEAILASNERGSDEPKFRYFPELSHGIPLATPEHLLGRPDMRDLDKRYDSLAQILKPHGSIHFFQVREGVRSMLGGASMIGLTPILDLDFDPSRMQRDLRGRLRSWDFIEPTPFIVPPVMNKDVFLGSDYFREMLQLTYRAIARADNVIVLGFSLPASDLHMGAVLEAIDWRNKRIALYHRDGLDGISTKNWHRVVRTNRVETLSNTGISCESVAAIDAFWKQLRTWCEK